MRIDQREHRPLVSPDQLAECRVAPLLGQRDDVGIREIEEVEGWQRRHRLDGPRRIEHARRRVTTKYVACVRQTSRVALIHLHAPGNFRRCP